MNHSKNSFRLVLAYVFILSIFADAYFASVFGIDLKKYGTLLFLGLSIFEIKQVFAMPKSTNIIVLSAILLLILSFPFWDSGYNAYSYIGIVIAYIGFSVAGKQIIELLKYILILSVILAIYEYLSNAYLFESHFTNVATNESVTIDEKYSAGSYGVFRSKSIFYGPLSFGVFLIGMATLFPQKMWVLILGMLGAFVANSRLAEVVISLFLLRYLIKYSGNNRKYIVGFVILGLLIFSTVNIDFENISVSLERTMDVFSFSDSSNSARMYYWQSAVSLFSDYGVSNLLLGNSGKFNMSFGNSTESGWLSLLVDNGIIGFLFYLIVLIRVYILNRNNKEIQFSIIIIAFVMLVITYHLSATSNFILWFTIFTFLVKDNNSWENDNVRS